MIKTRYFSGLVALICIFAACSREKGTEKQEKIIPVRVMTVAVSQTENSRNYIGTVEESVAVSLGDIPACRLKYFPKNDCEGKFSSPLI